MTTASPLQLFPLPGHDCRTTKDGWKGRFASLKLRQGIVVNIIKVAITADQANVFTASGPGGTGHIAGCIVLQGQLKIRFPNSKEFDLEPQKFSLFPTKSLNFRVTAPKQEKLYLLTYCIPENLLRWSIKGNNSHVSACLNSENNTRCRYLGIPVNPKIHRSVAEIMSARLSGQLLKLYLEGVILKSLALKIDLLEKLPAESDLLPPRSDDELLQIAHEALLSDLVNPPTIRQLASKLGMPEKRLSAGFRKLFGESVHDTLLTRRMTLAMEKLEEGKLPLNKIANAVGYRHVSNFISAFTRYHGLPPRAYLKQSK